MNANKLRKKVNEVDQIVLLFDKLSKEKQQRALGFTQGLVALGQFEQNCKGQPDEKIYEKEQ